MTVQSIKKVKKGYEVIIDNDTYIFEEDVIIKHRIRKFSDITERMLRDMIEDNHYYIVRKKGLKYLKNLHSVKSFKTYLTRHTDDVKLIDKLTNEAKKLGYLDDTYYAKMLVERYQNSYGFKRIENSLISKGIHRDIINKLAIDVPKDILESKVIKAVNQQKKPTYMLAYQTLLRQFVAKGYELDLVKPLIEKHLKQVEFDTATTLLPQINKLMIKYQELPKDKQLFKVKQALYQKGFKLDDIEKQFIEMGLTDV